MNVYRPLQGRDLLVQGARVSDYGETTLIGTWMATFRAVKTVSPNSSINFWYLYVPGSRIGPAGEARRNSIAIMPIKQLRVQGVPSLITYQSFPIEQSHIQAFPLLYLPIFP